LNEKLRTVLLIFSGILVGLCNGLLGGGGGIICIAVLAPLLRLSAKESHATALFIMLPVTVVSVIVYLVSGRVDWLLTLFATVGIVIGGAIGAKLLRKLRTPVVQIIFALFLIFAGVRML